MKIFRWTGLFIGLVILIVGMLSKPNNDSTLNPFPMSLSEAVAEAASPSGMGIFIVTSCSTITNPVVGGTWCFIPGPPPNISIYTNTGFQSYIPSNQPADFGFDFIGVPSSNLLLKYVVLRSYTIPANFVASGNAASSSCSAGTAANDTAIFNIQHNGSTVATATFAGSATTCTFSTQAGFTLVAGDTLAVVSPASPDISLANISISLGTTRN